MLYYLTIAEAQERLPVLSKINPIYS